MVRTMFGYIIMGVRIVMTIFIHIVMTIFFIVVTIGVMVLTMLPF